MSTKIQWTEETWNPIPGCFKVSPGCKNCYAIRQVTRMAGSLNEKIATRYLNIVENGNWTGNTSIDSDVLLKPLRTRKPTTFFISLSDLFFDKRPDDDVFRVFAVMALTHWHTYQILTKYADRMADLLGGGEFHTSVISAMRVISGEKIAAIRWPLPNVHLGVSVENQQYADERIPKLARTTAAVRFVSYEPALGPVDFRRWTESGLECSNCEWSGCEETAVFCDLPEESLYRCPVCRHECAHTPLDELIDWVIVGGESGHGARPFDIEWARNTIRQCKAAGVPVFVKQLGAKPINSQDGCLYCANEPHALKCNAVVLTDKKGGDMDEWPEDLRVRELPGGAA